MIRRLMRLFRWLVRVASWLHEAWAVWGAVLVMTVALLNPFTSPAWEARVRITGMLLQLFGISTVVVELHKTQTLFHKPSLRKMAVGWFARFPKFGVETQIVVGSGGVSSRVAVTGYGTVSLPPTASLEERIAALERGLNQANGRIHQVENRIGEEARIRSSALESERRERVVEDQSNQQLIEKAAAGDLHLEFIGVLWLALGVILATASNEIVSMFVTIGI